MPTVERRPPLPGLTALRLIAATYVLLFHFLPRHPADPAHPTLALRWLDAGFTGVSAFFILSGFILAYTHEQVPNLGRFYRARFARVYPLYLLALFWSVAPFVRSVAHDHHWALLWALPADLLLVQAWSPSLILLVNAPAWTLSCEAFFYLLFPFCIALLTRLRRRAVALIVLFWACELSLPVLVNTWLARSGPAVQNVAHGFLLTPAARLGEFLAGILLGLHFLGREHPDAPDAAAGGPWLLPGSLLVCLAALSLNGQVPHEVMRNGLMLGPYALLVWSLACSRSSWLAARPLQLGGEISYGVYLLQMPYSHTLALLLRHLPTAFQWSLLWLPTIYPVAYLTYLFVEKPCRALLLGRRPWSGDKPIPTPQPQLP